MIHEKRVIDLEQQLSKFEKDSRVDIHSKIDVLNELAWLLVDIDLKRAYALSKTAYALASSPDGDNPQYQAGIAYSLRTQGYLNQRLGDYPLGLTQLLKALEIVETLKIDDALPDVLDGIAGIYYQISDYPEALNYMYKQLESAERIGDKRRIANAYNNLSVAYSEMGDYTRSAETQHKNLKIAVEIGYRRIECISLLNIAGNTMKTGDYQKALEYGLHGLLVSQEAGFELFEVYAYDTLGRAHLKLGNSDQALINLENALALSRKIDSKVTESLILSNLGEAYQEMGQLDQAIEYLLKGAATAQAIDAKDELFKAHLHLSEIYEKQGEFSQALFHFKQYHDVREQVYNEKADQRLKVLQVAHDTETTRKEAEIFRLKAQQLELEITERNKIEAAQQEARDKLEELVKKRTSELSDTVAQLNTEIAEREQAEAEIQNLVKTLEQRVAARTDELVTFFDLILLAGQAATPIDVIEQALPRILEVTRSRAICIHRYDADHANLRMAAQLNLTAETYARLQTVELPADFRRWLQQPNDPLVTGTLSQLTILPSVFHQPEFQTSLCTQIRIGKQIEGVLSCYRDEDCGYGMDDMALIIALAEQIGMMLENHRLRQNAEEMAVLEERQRLARDLHDSVTQSLFSLSLFSRAGREAAEDGDHDRLIYSLTELERNTLHALREMRLLLYELRPADLEQGGLISAIEMRLNTVERRIGLQVDVQMGGYVGMSPAREIQFYHIIVEALNNVVKHAAATHLTLRLTQAGGNLQLRIVDDGRGFDPAQVIGGMGLENIRERVARLGGQLSITSEPGCGTQLEILIPCQEEECNE